MNWSARSRRTSLLWLAVVLLSAAPLRAASPRDEVLRFVPDDVGFCFVMQDLRVHAADLAGSPFVEQLRRSPVGAALQASKELGQLDQIDRDLRKSLGAGFDQLRDDLLGDAVVFAYRPGPPGKPEQEQGLILLRAHSAQVLLDFVEKINAAQKKDGTVSALQEVAYQGTAYYRRVEARRTNYYYLRGPVLMFSGQEEMLRQAIDVERKLASDAEPPLARRLREVGADRAALALWVDPRAFDAQLEEKTAKAEGADAALQKKVLSYWKAVDGIAAWATLDTELHVSLAAQVRWDDLPPAARRLLTAASRPSEAWRYFPDDALVACGGRIDAGALLELLQDFRPPSDGSPATANILFGKDFLTDFLSHVGPDWGFCLTAPATDRRGGVTPPLPEALLVVRASGDDTAPVDQALLSAVHTAALLAVMGYNHDHPTDAIRLQSTTYDKHEIHYLVGDRVLPPGVRPAYGLMNGWLTFASSPDVLRRFAETPPKPAPDDGAEFPLLRVSLKAWRAYLTERREPLAAALAEKNQMGVEEMRRRLDDLVGALAFVDRLEIDCRADPGQAVVTLTVQTAEPLKRNAP